MPSPSTVRSSTFFLAISLASCGGGSSIISTNSSEAVPSSQIALDSGFSTSYLSGKTFYQPAFYQGNKYIKEYRFSSQQFSEIDELFSTQNDFVYLVGDDEIEAGKGEIKGLIAFANLYASAYQLQSINEDHLKVCFYYEAQGVFPDCDEQYANHWFLQEQAARDFLSQCDSEDSCK